MSSLGRVIGSLVIAGLILFPGIELLRFVVKDILGLYAEFTNQEALLFFVIVLLCALILGQRAPAEGRSSRRSREDRELRLAGNDPRRSKRTSGGRKQSREPSRRPGDRR